MKYNEKDDVTNLFKELCNKTLRVNEHTKRACLQSDWLWEEGEKSLVSQDPVNLCESNILETQVRFFPILNYPEL